ncbi:tRNA nucleotidyltransferase [Lentithecium fluviatile CBS 122367]|uniref:tRNA nucleotidyltransferase n=1 Tax=Lentithecium fluviatile CBS 122367 TaxID=1168545 RepID=A0A6G1IVG5_9PLEO|nr:tRNA nucleotidyltransferase [Lentithecium fluviatile CBS 122367]
MASSSNSRPTTLELTESETRLRDVLLGVAAYIDEAPGGERSATQAPDELAKEKIILRWTGGWVRDKLLGVGSHDIDVAINKLTGENFGLKMLEYLKIPGNDKKHGLGEKESKRIVSGLHTIKANPEASKNLETATIRIMGIDLDLVNLRKESYNEVSRNPQMEFGTAEEDAMRRDATVNAMFYNLNTKQIEDFTKRGFADMDAKIIRTPLEPYQTFKDDPLRVLRLIRFASRLGYTIEPKTASAMGNVDIQEALKIKIKRERVGIELEKMLKGPDPHMALELINRFNLYGTIFTDPTRKNLGQPEPIYFTQAYDLVKFIQDANEGTPATISRLLLREADERYLAWICAAVMPWADAPEVPNSKPSRKPFHAACLVAQEGFKAPNSVCNVIAASLDHSKEIKKLVEGYHKKLRQVAEQNVPREATARDTLGMAIRRWGPTWRSQVLFSLIHEVALGTVSKERILSQYADFLKHLENLEILDADTFKPLVKGTDLAKAMDLKPGPWMKDALEVVMAWQLRNPDITDPTEAIEEVKKTRKGELTSRLISEFLSLTIRPLFSQPEPDTMTLPPKSKTKTWRDPENAYVVDLLRWILESSTEADIKREIHRLHVPIFKMLDDKDLKWKAKACEFVNLFVKAAPRQLIMDRGYKQMFADELFPLFTYLPTLTPEDESALVFDHAFPALITLSCIEDTKDEKMLDRTVRDGVVNPMFHLPSPSSCPKLTTVVLTHLDTVLDNLGTNSVKHLQPVFPYLFDIIRDEFAPAAPALLISAAKALQSAIRNGWAVMNTDRLMWISGAICESWKACCTYGVQNDADLESVKKELKEVMLQVDCGMMIHGNIRKKAKRVWLREKKKLLIRPGDSSIFAELFEHTEFDSAKLAEVEEYEDDSSSEDGGSR